METAIIIQDVQKVNPPVPAKYIIKLVSPNCDIFGINQFKEAEVAIKLSCRSLAGDRI